MALLRYVAAHDINPGRSLTGRSEALSCSMAAIYNWEVKSVKGAGSQMQCVCAEGERRTDTILSYLCRHYFLFISVDVALDNIPSYCVIFFFIVILNVLFVFPSTNSKDLSLFGVPMLKRYCGTKAIKMVLCW